MLVRIIGCGDAFGSGGRFNTCFLLEHLDEKVLIDCGASSLIALKKYDVDPDTIGTIVITHLHGDHFGGLVFLLREATLFKRRSLPLHLAGPKGFIERLKMSMEAFFPNGWIDNPTFGLTIKEYEGEQALPVGAAQVKPYLVKHACGAPPYALRVMFGGKIITYSGDTEWVDALIPAAADADLFLCESYFFSKPIPRHLSYETIANRMSEIAPRRILLTHMSEEMLQRLDEVAYPTAEDGMVIELG